LTVGGVARTTSDANVGATSGFILAIRSEYGAFWLEVIEASLHPAVV